MYSNKTLLTWLLMASLFLSGCAHTTSPARDKMPQWGESTLVPPETQVSRPPTPPADKEPPKPRFKNLSPLDLQKVSISFYQEDYRAVLQVLARAAGFNLVIDDEAEQILGSGRALTADFSERPVRTVLDHVCRALDVTWTEENGTIYVRGLQRLILDLDFLSSVQESRFNVGGDVLGGGSSGSSDTDMLTPLKGNFELSGGQAGESRDIYGEIQSFVAEHVGSGGTYSLNRATGTLMVIARPHIVQEINSYMETIKEKYRRQVLIEAKILEVNLNSSHELGIDWKKFEATISQNALRTTGTTLNVISEALNENSVWYGLQLSDQYYNVSTILHALEEYGSVNTLSNPRLKVLNGQSAMISVGQSVSYLRSFELETTGTDVGTTQSPTVEIGSLFDGVLLGVTPEIEESGNVSLHLVPIKSEIISLAEKEYQGGNRYAFPVVNLREASTVVRARSGELVILGGLIQDKKQDDDSGLPGFQDIPLIGSMFKYSADRRQRVELVIILRLQVL
ncbi:pilus (MSHA type) biogenesis protein MshL [Desulfolithobacter dissulfuricans]|uniref:Pilus (MSHA type) biogenesis protein MshL n=1 Tax=Desulfolithobacter dissulfuricans TaxID=2795293 RepID=A0A915TZ61_9BACT|nr:pilus (MSHA type) biogenesis protein MshL [Desulfolithobacter dissulfuricans]BCO08474.1 pilus (MSHA type) biogenesis protein MshL [Desulfolithobacter dissulfuricans]